MDILNGFFTNVRLNSPIDTNTGFILSLCLDDLKTCDMQIKAFSYKAALSVYPIVSNFFHFFFQFYEMKYQSIKHNIVYIKANKFIKLLTVIFLIMADHGCVRFGCKEFF